MPKRSLWPFGMALCSQTQLLYLRLHSSADLQVPGGYISYEVIAQCHGGACDDTELVWCNVTMLAWWQVVDDQYAMAACSDGALMVMAVDGPGMLQ